MVENLRKSKIALDIIQRMASTLPTSSTLRPTFQAQAKTLRSRMNQNWRGLLDNYMRQFGEGEEEDAAA